MARLPPRVGPPHRIEKLRQRVARLKREGRAVGILMVRPGCHGTQRGRPWGRRFEDPQWAAEVGVSVDGEFDDPFYRAHEELDALVAELDRGRWRAWRVDGLEFDVEWLDAQSVRAAAREDFGVELTELSDLGAAACGILER